MTAYEKTQLKLSKQIETVGKKLNAVIFAGSDDLALRAKIAKLEAEQTKNFEDWKAGKFVEPANKSPKMGAVLPIYSRM